MLTLKTLNQGTNQSCCSNKGPILSSRLQRVGKTGFRILLKSQDCLFLLSIISTRYCCCLILSSCILTGREQASQVSGNITSHSALSSGCRIPLLHKSIQHGWLGQTHNTIQYNKIHDVNHNLILLLTHSPSTLYNPSPHAHPVHSSKQVPVVQSVVQCKGPVHSSGHSLGSAHPIATPKNNNNIKKKCSHQKL